MRDKKVFSFNFLFHPTFFFSTYLHLRFFHSISIRQIFFYTVFFFHSQLFFQNLLGRHIQGGKGDGAPHIPSPRHQEVLAAGGGGEEAGEAGGGEVAGGGLGAVHVLVQPVAIWGPEFKNIKNLYQAIE